MAIGAIRPAEGAMLTPHQKMFPAWAGKLKCIGFQVSSDDEIVQYQPQWRRKLDQVRKHTSVHVRAIQAPHT